MCVIIYASGKGPSLDTLRQIEEQNHDGTGMGWREDGKLFWKKGLTSQEVFDLFNEKKGQRVAHYRQATVGTPSTELCHPFPFNTGRKHEKALLFHNGHFSEWQKDCRKTCVTLKKKFPDEEFSDSKAIAWLCSIYGTGYLRLIPSSKFLVMDEKEVTMYGDFSKKDGIWYSNLYWENSYLIKYGFSAFQKPAFQKPSRDGKWGAMYEWEEEMKKG